MEPDLSDAVQKAYDSLRGYTTLKKVLTQGIISPKEYAEYTVPTMHLMEALEYRAFEHGQRVSTHHQRAVPYELDEQTKKEYGNSPITTEDDEAVAKGLTILGGFAGAGLSLAFGPAGLLGFITALASATGGLYAGSKGAEFVAIPKNQRVQRYLTNGKHQSKSYETTLKKWRAARATVAHKILDALNTQQDAMDNHNCAPCARMMRLIIPSALYLNRQHNTLLAAQPLDHELLLPYHIPLAKVAPKH